MGRVIALRGRRVGGPSVLGLVRPLVAVFWLSAHVGNYQLEIEQVLPIKPQVNFWLRF
ncbi:hypothetical protein CFELI_02020 [Corynebacterium felinum]|nr:hypothetical protein CFELI_02020 [Corynebacterium felinum]